MGSSRFDWPDSQFALPWVLLNHATGDLSRYRIAKEADVSTSWASDYLDELAHEGLIEDTAVRDMERLYERWVETRIMPNAIRVSLQKPLKTIGESGVEYALGRFGLLSGVF